ncbi:hypothetical protein L7D48_21150 [Streptomyces sp. S1A]|uniref:hypothetical protein n=1 Tax=Streptomyces sp. ICN903 TaxID=2964654 RepID=UPI001EDB7CAC|nr:hypothetical protein [Streptomyces sp. ICN903]MCG3043045.1 hypothetical protein [Streptomyces sp. ICN903]
MTEGERDPREEGESGTGVVRWLAIITGVLLAAWSSALLASHAAGGADGWRGVRDALGSAFGVSLTLTLLAAGPAGGGRPGWVRGAAWAGLVVLAALQGVRIAD